MAKGEDIVRRKKNKEIRKKLNRDSSNVSARIASIIASKKRRKSGKRRMCQGMCFSLPTPDDPFNDRYGDKDRLSKDKKKVVLGRANKNVVIKEKDASLYEDNFSGNYEEKNHLKKMNENLMNSGSKMKKSIRSNEKTIALLKDRNSAFQQLAHENSDFTSKFFVLCLNAIEKVLCHGTYNVDKSLFVNPWGVEFLKCCLDGKDILETSGPSCTTEQIAWIVSFATDTISRKEKEGVAVNSPFLLFLVPSQEKAVKVRMLCKPLKDFGIHTVSLHPGASLDHQIHGLKSCDPEFIISTPERLTELVSKKAIDISSISFLVVDGIDYLYEEGCLGTLKTIRQSIMGNPITVVFNDKYTRACVEAVQDLLLGPVCRLSSSDAIGSLSACIIQSVDLCCSQEEKLSKGIQVLCGAHNNQRRSACSKVLYIVENDSKCMNLVESLKVIGYRTSTDGNNRVEMRRGEKPAVSIVKAEDIGRTELREYEMVIVLDFRMSIDDYKGILKRMARHTVHGVLHSLLTEEDAADAAGPLLNLMEDCGQSVPEALRALHIKYSMLH